MIECNGLGSQLVKDRNGRFFKPKNLAINKFEIKQKVELIHFFSCRSLKKNMLELSVNSINLLLQYTNMSAMNCYKILVMASIDNDKN